MKQDEKKQDNKAKLGVKNYEIEYWTYSIVMILIQNHKKDPVIMVADVIILVTRAGQKLIC